MYFEFLINHLLFVAKALKFFVEHKTGKTVEARVTTQRPRELRRPHPQEVSTRRGTLTVWETIMN